MPKPKLRSDELQTLLNWQNFDGSFALSADFCQFTARKAEKEAVDVARQFLESAEPMKEAWQALNEDSRKKIIATLLALGFLVSKLKKRKAEWDMVAKKAVDFLAQFKQLPRSQYETLASSLLTKF